MRSVSPQRTMRLAGLRSDQLGICREPQFQSKKRAPVLNPPQVSTSLRWEDPAVLTREQIITRGDSPPAVASVTQRESGQNRETLLASNTTKPIRDLTTTLVQEECSSDHISRTSADQQTQKQPSDKLNHALRKKAALKSAHKKNVGQNSEYQRQFQWKTSAAESPLLTAQEMLYSSTGSLPPLKSNPEVMESEYKRCFKGSPPPKGPRLRREIELNETPPPKMENITTGKSKKKKQWHQRLSKKSSPKEKNSRSESLPVKQKLKTPLAQKAASPRVMRKVKTEYSANFRSPLQYCHRDGACVASRTVGEEVRELREKAEEYRKRAWGSHFSRQHLSQILSDQNCLWEESSSSSLSTLTDENHSSNSLVVEALDLASVRESCIPSASVSLASSRRSSCNEEELPSSPTLPGQRTMAWVEDVSPCERGLPETKQQRRKQPDETSEKGNMNWNSENNTKGDIVAGSERLPHAEASGSSSNEGRLPTPKLQILPTAQRTHHDRTTPLNGGAILASPPKIQYSKTSRRSELPLGKARSLYRHLSCVSIPERNRKPEGASPSCSPQAAGLATVDPLPLREEETALAEDILEMQSDPKAARKSTSKKASSAWIIDSTPSHANRIKGTMRDPEFQHNGNLGIHWPGRTVHLSNDLSNDDLDERMSQISFRSAASCSMASQILDRAQKRKENFWGKT